jgi:hypothetical protein
MLADAVTRTDLAIYLGIYASVVSTAAGLWALFAGVLRDRARITVKANEAYLVSTAYGQRSSGERYAANAHAVLPGCCLGK